MRRPVFFRTLLVLLLLLIPYGPALLASDHADAPGNADDRGTDLADSYFFVDPNDATRVVMIMTFAGFIVPGENSNLGLFSENGAARFNFEIENTGDAVPDRFYRVTFGPKTSSSGPQTATIELRNRLSPPPGLRIRSYHGDPLPTPMYTRSSSGS